MEGTRTDRYTQEQALKYITDVLSVAPVVKLGEVIKFIRSGYRFDINPAANESFSDLIVLYENAEEKAELEKGKLEILLESKLTMKKYREIKAEIKRYNIIINTCKHRIGRLAKKQRMRTTERKMVDVVKNIAPDVFEEAMDFVQMAESR